jgi:aconitate hydratase
MAAVTLSQKGAYLTDGRNWVEDGPDCAARLAAAGFTGPEALRENARLGTMAAGILAAHGTSEGDDLRIRFDKLVSHDITYVGIIQTARASGLTSFPMPYVLTNCHNSLCAVGGTINEDDHLFGLSAARRFGGCYVPPHLAVIHEYARERMAECGSMILGSDSHTRYGALGTLAMGEGGPELVKQLLGQTYDIRRPEVVAVNLTGCARARRRPPGCGACHYRQRFCKRICEKQDHGICGGRHRLPEHRLPHRRRRHDDGDGLPFLHMGNGRRDA